VLDNACETAAEHAAEHPEEPLDVWRLVERYRCPYAAAYGNLLVHSACQTQSL